MHIHNLSNNNSVLNSFLFEIRDETIQKDSLRFRRNIERIGEILCYELSKVLQYSVSTVNTPLGSKSMQLLSNDDVVICSILRAGLPLHMGVLNYFDKAHNAFISAYRKHKNGTSDFEIMVEYVACPSIKDKTLVLVDPMLATGQSLALTYEALKPYGSAKEVHLLSVIGAQKGVDYIQNKFPVNTHLWIGDIDPELNEKGYIIPGLGDAGDLAYGTKLQQ